MRVEYINPFLASTMKVLQTMAMTDAKPGKPYKKEDQSTHGVISAIIPLTGGTRGSISISFTESCIVSIVNNMLGESYEALNDDVADAVGELTNMISGEARRELAEEGFIFQAGIPALIKGDNHLLEHGIHGIVAAIPFKTKDGTFTVEACFESEQYFDQSAENQKKAAIKESNSALIPIQLSSFMSDNHTKFRSYALKPNSQVMAPNFFLVPEYIGPTEGNDYCNFTALEIHICPETLFASNVLNYFRHSQNPTNELLEDPALKERFTIQMEPMKDMLGGLSKTMNTVKRTTENAVLAYQLAMRTSELLYSYDSDKFGNELHKLGEYALKAAVLAKIEKSMDREQEFLGIALGAYRKILPTAMGEQFFRCCFRVVALSVYLEEYASAKSSISMMIKHYQEHSSEIVPESAPRIKRYIQLVDKIFKAKEDYSMSRHQDRTNYQFLE
ncbi:MAG: chemotaxis protein CheX [SAR324 cluster bacterium]|nr:chemotaxis protein CheX [SAR324 cluster bacterium]